MTVLGYCSDCDEQFEFVGKHSVYRTYHGDTDEPQVTIYCPRCMDYQSLTNSEIK